MMTNSTMDVTGTVVLSLQLDSEIADRRVLLDGSRWPEGIRVVLDVGDRTYPHPWTIGLLRKRGRWVRYDVHGTDVHVVGAWVSALRGAADELGCA